MKTQNALLLATAAFVVGIASTNVAFSNSTGSKIAIVDINAVVHQSAQVANLKKEQIAKTEDLQKWLKTVSADVEKQKTQEGKEKLVKKYNSEFEKKKEAINKTYGEKLSAIDKSITNTISTEAKNRGYDIVISKNVVLYGGDDLTDVIKKVVK